MPAIRKNRSSVRLSLSAATLLTCTGLLAQRPIFDAPFVAFPDDTLIDAVVDFDGDGDADTIGVWWPDNSHIAYRGFRNDGAGAFSQAWSITRTAQTRIRSPSPTRVLVGNLDGQGPLDFVTWDSGDPYRVGFATGFIAAYSCAAGSGAPTLLWNLPYPDIRDVALGDFDGDGLDDLVTNQGNRVYFLRSNAGGPPTIVMNQPYGDGSPGDADPLLVARIDGDALPDVVVLDGTLQGAQVVVMPGTATGIGAPINYPIPLSLSVVVGDIDGDGDNDIVAFHLIGNSYTVLRNVGGVLSVEASRTGGPATSLIDVDGDGDLDGACCTGGGGGSGNVPGGYNDQQLGFFDTMRVCINDGAGNFGPAVSIPSTYAARLAGGADFDLDGRMDLVAGRAIMYGSERPFVKALSFLNPSASQIADGHCDIDGDGDIDLNPGYVATFPNHQLRNRGNGEFDELALTILPPAGWWRSVLGYSGDWDGDGDPDVVVGEYSTTAPTRARLLSNLGNGQFVDSGITSPIDMMLDDYRSRRHVAGDVDSDGDLDVLVLDSDGSCVARLNDGLGHFTAGPAFPAVPLAVADFDGDGLQDLLGSMGNRFRVRLGQGGTNGSAWFDPGPAPISWRFDALGNSIADVDGDGDLDVFAVDLQSGVWLYRNDGSGHLDAGTVMATFPQPAPYWLSTAVAMMADLDGDGRVDLLYNVAVAGPDIVEIRLGIGGGAFAPPIRQVLRQGSLALDLDGDGDAELITLGPSYSQVYWNRTYQGPAAGSIEQFGARLNGTPNADLVLGERGWLHSDRLGFFEGEVRVRGGVPGTFGTLGIGFVEQPTPLFGGTVYTNPILTVDYFLGGPPGVPGAGTFDFPWSLGLWAAGLDFVLQTGALDPLAPQGVALSNGVRKSIGF